MAATPRLSETGRLEAFSDGVFAIVLTLLVLDLLPDGAVKGAAELLGDWPKYLAFVTAFLTVGSIWLSHHDVFTRIARVDPLVLVLNLGLLLATTLVPWPQALVGAALESRDREAETAAVLVYSLVTLLVGGAWTALEAVLARRVHLLRSTADAAWMRRTARYSASTIGVAVVGALLAFVSPIAAIVVYLVVPALFVLLSLRGREAPGATTAAPPPADQG